MTSNPPLTSTPLPREVDPKRLRKRGLQTVGLLLVLVAIVLFAPGLGEVRTRLGDASPGWLAVAAVLEFLSGCSYVVLFRPVFCPKMSWRTSWEISWAELGMGSIVPASGAGGLALGAWILNRSGMPGEQIARRSVAFFLIKSSVNFVAVAVLGFLFAVGLIGPHQPLWRTLVPAVLAVLAIVLVVEVGRLGEPSRPDDEVQGVRRLWIHTRRALVGGVREAVTLVRELHPGIFIGSIGYWAFDNAVLWATFHAVGASPPLSVILMGYLIGQLGGALPLPGGIGGIDLGLVGTLIVFGAPAQETVAAVLAYRLILFWLPLIIGAFSFWSLRRALNQPDRPDICFTPVPETVSLPHAR